MTVRFAPRALRDIDAILGYIAKRSPRGAYSVSVAIERAVEARARRPRLGTPTEEPNIFRWPIGKYRITFLYRVVDDGSGIEIAAVVRSGRVRDIGRIPDET